MLNFNMGGGSNKPYIRYMASTASWQMDGGNFQFTQGIFDLENIKTGWCLIETGTAPQWIMDEDLTRAASKPDGEGWKRGFKVDIYSKSMFGDEQPVREWATNSTGATMAIQSLYAQYMETKEAGKSPVVDFAGAVPTKVGKGNTNVPTLKIVKYVDTPLELVSAPAAISNLQPVQGASISDAEF